MGEKHSDFKFPGKFGVLVFSARRFPELAVFALCAMWIVRAARWAHNFPLQTLVSLEVLAYSFLPHAHSIHLCDLRLLFKLEMLTSSLVFSIPKVLFVQQYLRRYEAGRGSISFRPERLSVEYGVAYKFRVFLRSVLQTSRAAVAGSFASAMFLEQGRGCSWLPNDVDIFFLSSSAMDRAEHLFYKMILEPFRLVGDRVRRRENEGYLATQREQFHYAEEVVEEESEHYLRRSIRDWISVFAEHIVPETLTLLNGTVDHLPTSKRDQSYVVKRTVRIHSLMSYPAVLFDLNLIHIQPKVGDAVEGEFSLIRLSPNCRDSEIMLDCLSRNDQQGQMLFP